MRELSIAYGRSSSAKLWKNSATTWDDLCAKLKTTVRTRETVAEYKAMTKTEKAAVKDKGGFVGGYLKDGRRLVQNVEYRSFLTLDADKAQPGFIDRFVRECDYAAVIYTTHGHTPDEPRVRIILPFEEDITPDCYAAVARYFTAVWGIDQFDECSYRINQLMYWPTTPSDGEYICKVVNKPFLNAVEFLDAYPDWRDCSKLPVSSKEKEVKTHDGKKQEDPLTKDGIVGVFCRTYTIQDTISKFLSDIYAPSAMEGRYDYIPGEGTAGVVVYDDKFAYSHHATDPAGGKLLNAFDLVRLHRFGNEDEKTSFLKMCELAESDELVKEVLNKEKLEQAQKDFEEKTSKWEEPIPFGRYEIEKFPVEALPPDIGDYVSALSESLQTPVDIAGTSSLGVMGTATQKKYVIRGKKDWVEPLCVYAESISPPSERKSAIDHGMVKPISNYENKYNIYK